MSRIEMERELVRQIQLLALDDKPTYDETMKIFKKIYANDKTVENEHLEKMFFPRLAEILRQKNEQIYDLFIKVFPKYSVHESSLSETHDTYSTLEREAEKEFLDYYMEDSESSSKKGGKRRKTNHKKRSKQKRTWRKYFGL